MLETRMLLSSALLADYAAREAAPHDAIYDAMRGVLYTIHDESIRRFDTRAGEWLSSWSIGEALGGADITADGAYLCVVDTELVDGRGVIHRINLADGSVSELRYDLTNSAATGDDLVITDDAKALVVGSGKMRLIDVISGDIAIVGGPGGPNDDVYAGELTRGADRDTVLVQGSAMAGPFSLYEPSTATLLGQRSYGLGFKTAVSHDGALIAFESPSAGGGTFSPEWDGSPIADRALDFTRRLPAGEIPAAFDPVRPLLYSINVDTDRISVFDTNSWEKLYDFAADKNYEPGMIGRNRVITIADDGSKLFVAMPPGTNQYSQATAGELRMFSLGDTPEISGIGLAAPVGEPVNFTVTIRDSAGKVVPDFTGTVTFHSDNANDELPPPLTFVSTDGGAKAASVTFAARNPFFGPQRRTTLRAVIAETGAADSVEGFKIDAQPPTATMPWFSQGYGSNNATFYITYADDDAPAVASIGDDDLIVRGPSGAELSARIHPSITPYVDMPGRSVRVSYEILPPGGDWDHTDNGVYEIAIRDGAVTDTAGNSVAATPTTFTVDIEPPPTPGPDAIVSMTTSGIKNGRVKTGSTLTSRVKILNDGDLPLESANISVYLFNGYNQIGEAGGVTRQLNLKPGKSTTVTVKVRIAADEFGGRYALLANVESLGIEDKNPNNNDAVSPDFDVIELAVPLVSDPEPLTLQASEYRTATFILQNGRKRQVRGEFEIDLIATPIGSFGGTRQTIDDLFESISLQPGERSTITVNFSTPSALVGGQYNVTLKARPYVERRRPSPSLGSGDGASLVGG